MLLLGILVTLATIQAENLEKIDLEDKNYWRSVGAATLDNILNRKRQENVAKNVIIFVGDGMGVSTVTAARIYEGQLKNGKGEDNVLSFEKFPAVGLSKTYDVTHQVTDSAASATAMFSGVKIRHNVLGLDAMAQYNSCDTSINQMAKIPGMMTWAQEKGKDTGIITTTRITHATPGATYAHTNNRDWECDSAIPPVDANCVKDIARQLVEDLPGKNFKVILGGGQQQFGVSEASPNVCKRTDGKNLVNAWLGGKKNAEYVTTAKELSNIDVEKTEYLLGLFAPSHLSFVAENDPNRPSLTLMTETAIKILQKNSNGFVLMVEGGRIDLAHHQNQAKLAFTETIELSEAVAAAFAMTDPSETLIIVTADHSHCVVMNGYPLRGNDILGLAENTNKSFFQTITYTNGPGYEYHHSLVAVDNCKGECSEIEKHSANSVRDIRNDTKRFTDIYYQQFAAFYREDDTHGGEDVAVYASGPMSHLLTGVYEQSYIASVISYASCIGPEAHRCVRRDVKSSSVFMFSHFSFSLLILPALMYMFEFYNLKF